MNIPTKAIVLLAAALLAPGTLLAQGFATDRGSLLLDGEASFTNSGYRGDASNASRTTQVIINPSVQYFVLPGLSVGGSLQLVHQVLDSALPENSALTMYGVGPAASYYFGSGERSFYPFVSGSATYLRYTNGIDPALGLRASGGLLFMLSRNVGVTIELYYSTSKQGGGGFDYSSYGLAVGVSAFVF